MAKVIIEFTGSWRGYGKGEVAGFEEDVAQSLVDGGRAQLYEGRKAGKPGGAKPKSTAASKGPATNEAPQPGPVSGPAPGETDLDTNSEGGDSEDDDKP